ncbi:stem 28 kDa glycoprotein-like [Phragmites australis]|nr:stem 28 kDa glycoprotein-like [Phragmites australis]
MAVAKLLAAVLLALAASCGAWEVKLAIEDDVPLIHMLRPLLGSGGHLGRRGRVPCDSWRFAVETNTLRGWRTIPARCEKYVGNYMLGGHYRSDSRAVVDEAVAYAEGLNLTGEGKEVWVFDVDETTLSNLPYYAEHGFGAEPYNSTLFGQYVKEANAPALPESLRLYKRLQSLGIKPVILTGRREDKREATAKNLELAGYVGYEKLLLKPVDARVPSMEFKSGERKKLEDAGYVIVGNIGDQWTDILGAPEGGRTFKLPDPMYYVG